MALEQTESFGLTLPGKRLTSIQFYNVNENYFVFHPKSLAVIDGGVELDFEGQKLVIGWNSERALFDVDTNSIKPLLGEEDYYQIESADLQIGQNLIGSSLISLEPKWNWFQETNDEMEPIGPKHYIPMEVILRFENSHTFQIAAIQYEIKDRKLSNVSYDCQNELLLSVDQIVPIENTL